jgi:glycosyltransferase involved in cell wall biosynthesis
LCLALREILPSGFDYNEAASYLKIMKIVFLVRSLNYGGVERQLVIMAKGMDKTRFEPVVLCFYGGGALQAEIAQAGIRVISLDKHDRWDVIGFLWRLSRKIAELKPDVLHGYLPVPNFLAALLKLVHPSMRVVLGVRTSGKELGNYDWTFRLSFWLERLFARLADLVIVNSQAGKTAYLKKGFPPEKIVVISNGIDTEVFHPEAVLRRALRAEWGVAETALLVGIIGRLDPMKGHSVFLKAAAALDRSDMRFVVVGDGPQAYRQRLVDLGNSLGLGKRLVWAASRRDVTPVYNALDICCSASLFGEGFPNVVGEAMACGIPCVVTAIGDSDWVAGNTGIAVAPNDCNALSEAIARLSGLSREERSNLGQQARQRVVENFSAGLMIRRTEDTLEALVGDGRK